MAERLIIDTDPGQDDAFAILLALASPEFEVLGLTAVAGNVPVSTTAANCRRLVEIAGKSHIPAFAGCDRPLLRPARHAADIHGEGGIDGYDFAAPAHPVESKHAVDWLVETLLASPEKSVTITPLGPMTNIAAALIREPKIASRIKRIVNMGGGFFEGGNIAPAAEFNILVDPEAAAIVFKSGVALASVPIDCTLNALTPDSWIADLAALKTPVGDACAGMMRFFEAYGNKKYGTKTRPLHDALAVGYALWPDLFSGRHCNVEIETSSPLTLGMTVVDWWGVSGRRANCFWVKSCDAEQFYARMLARLALLK
ncbi:nucleoside hydrolase [Terrarubrum flagellatum]|uniref:nucleoside hydrolase n=1 Tax=Terrirubrum flagellatum TaxID=2895980 RepID=UPI003144F6B5